MKKDLLLIIKIMLGLKSNGVRIKRPNKEILLVFLDFCPPDEIRKSHPERFFFLSLSLSLLKIWTFFFYFFFYFPCREISCDTICASPSQDLSQHLTLFPSPRVSPLPLKRSNVLSFPSQQHSQNTQKDCFPFPKRKEIIKGSLKEEEECLIDSSPQRGPSFLASHILPLLSLVPFSQRVGREKQKREILILSLIFPLFHHDLSLGKTLNFSAMIMNPFPIV